jgi:hypothetical protein
MSSEHPAQPDLPPADLPMVTHEDATGQVTVVVESGAAARRRPSTTPFPDIPSSFVDVPCSPVPPVASRSLWRRRVPLIVCLLAILFLATTGLWLGLAPLLRPPTATLVISPAYREMRAVIPLSAVLFSPTDPLRQVEARQLQVSTPARSQTTGVTGVQYTSAVAATGTVVYYNEASSWLTVGSGVILTGSDGMQVVTEAQVSVPPGDPPVSYGISAPVPVKAMQAGARGNIAAHDLKGPCCMAGIAVDNLEALSGGWNPRPYAVVSKEDIARVEKALSPELTRSSRSLLQGQVHAHELVVGPPVCTSHATVTPPVGSKAQLATVSVEVTCRNGAYDSSLALQKALSLYKRQVAGELGPDYVLQADHVRAVLRPGGPVKGQVGSVSLPVSVDGVWVYRWDSDTITRLVHRVAGMERGKALGFLVQDTGVLTAHILLTGSTTLPADPDNIRVTFDPVPLPRSP